MAPTQHYAETKKWRKLKFGLAIEDHDLLEMVLLDWCSSSPGPFSCPYTAECVEGEFSEVRINDPA
jgi:hypothetical protein